MTANAKVEQRHRDRAKQFVYDYNVRDCFGSREAPIEELAQDYANAEQRGRDDEREEAALEAEAVCVPLKWRHVMPERDVYEEAVQDCAAAIRGPQERSDEDRSRARGQRKEVTP